MDGGGSDTKVLDEGCSLWDLRGFLSAYERSVATSMDQRGVEAPEIGFAGALSRVYLYVVMYCFGRESLSAVCYACIMLMAVLNGGRFVA